MIEATKSELLVARRQVLGKKVKKLRRDGLTPANIFGRHLSSEAVEVPTEKLAALLKQISRNDIVYLIVGDGEAQPTLIRNVQKHPTSDELLHIDFEKISLVERVRVDVPIVLTGRSEAVETLGGTLLSSLDYISVEALPTEVPVQIEVDVSPLDTLEATLHVRDISLKKGIDILSDPDLVVTTVAPPRVEEEAIVAEVDEDEEITPEEGDGQEGEGESPESEQG